ncbi:hypothetical protein [Burkholderia sp. GS2Y]|uniref:Lipoprotein n=1 Tax=Burkholderia theae TaxID=3143496 RepID=A0ABU9WQY0_9BURK
MIIWRQYQSGAAKIDENISHATGAIMDLRAFDKLSIYGRNSGVILFSTLLLSACCIFNSNYCKTDTTKTTSTDNNGFDLFQKELAEKIAQRVGQNNQFTITPTLDIGVYPVGTLMPIGHTIEIQDICETKQPDFYPYDGLNTTLDLTQGVAVTAGLSEALGPIASAAATLNAKSKVTLGLSDASIQQLSTADLQNLLKDKKCVGKIAGQRLIMVRGYIQAKRSFTAHIDKNGSLKVGVSKIATFDANFDDGTQTLTLNDSSPFKFLQITSEINIVASQNGGSPLIVASPTQQGPQPDIAGKIYIQIDAADKSNRAESLKSALKTNFDVANGIEKIPSAKMPRQTQVRYFNAKDAQKAEAVLALVQQTNPDATLRYVGLPAPAGQLEVWLTQN